MEYIQDTDHELTPLNKQKGSFYTSLAKVTFVLYLFFSFFGTTLPFRERVRDVQEISTSNALNQVVFTLLFLTAVIAIIPRFKSLVTLLFKEKFYIIFLMWCLLSVVWSDYSFTSFKRWFQVFTAFTVFLSLFVHVNSSEQILKYLKYLFSIYVLISVAASVAIPGARDFDSTWRGLAPSKNHLGQAAVIAILIWAYAFKTDYKFKKIYSGFMLFLSVVLLLGSQSTTSLTAFLFVAFTGSILFFDNRFGSLGIGRTVSVILISLLVLLFVAVFALAPDIIAEIVGSAGKDLTFTGRTELWRDVLLEARKHLWLGAGFQGFWVLQNPNLLALYDVYIWLPNQAHSGYVDIINEVGIIGSFLFLLIIINYFVGLGKLKESHFWKWFFISALIINIQESGFIRPQVTTGVMFMFSYIALFAKLKEQKEIEALEDKENIDDEAEYIVQER